MKPPTTTRDASLTLVLLAALLPMAVLAGACGGEGSGPAVQPADHGAHGSTLPVEPPGAADGLRLDPRSYPPEVLEPLRTALAAYESARDLLASDQTAGLAPRAARLATALEQAGAAVDEAELSAVLQEATGAAHGLVEAVAGGELEPIRRAFGEVSRFLIPLVGADERLTEGRTVYACPMTEDGFDRWIGGDESLENPFMGRDMLTCGSQVPWSSPPASSVEEVETHAEHAHGADDGIAHYTCAMHPSVKSPAPGICPICSMELTPVTRAELASGVLLVDEGRRQAIGVKTAAVETRPVSVDVTAVGRVVVDETRRAEVTVKYRGWIQDLRVNEPGQRVQRGQTLFTLYSPDLYAAQEELLAAVASRERARGTSAPGRADYLVEAATRRLELWDLAPWQIDRLLASGKAEKYLPIVSPVSGHVVVKNVVAGAAVEPGETLFEIAGLDRVWVEAELYENELALVREGDPVTVTLPYLPGRRIPGKVAFIYPYLDGASRTGRVRVELANPGLELKPDMYASVEMTRDLGRTLVVPASAVIYAGPRRLVFVDLGGGRLRPQEVEVGPKMGDVYPVLAGLSPGDRVVTSGNFLIAAESRLKSALEVW
jgi:membrane fusion protein, copper/silver efflux system